MRSCDHRRFQLFRFAKQGSPKPTTEILKFTPGQCPWLHLPRSFCMTTTDRIAGRKAVVLVAPSYSEAFALEHSIHRPSRLLRDDVELVFRPDLDSEFKRHERGTAAGAEKAAFLSESLLVIPTWQEAALDLSEISADVNVVRRGLLAQFDVWAKSIRPRLSPYWSDCACPVDGCARYGTRTSAIYNELDGLTTLLHYDAVPVGCCGIVLHPKWHRRAYPVTFFTTAPMELVQAAIEAAEAEAAAEKSAESGISSGGVTAAACGQLEQAMDGLSVAELPTKFIDSSLATRSDFEASLLLPTLERAALEKAAQQRVGLQP